MKKLIVILFCLIMSIPAICSAVGFEFAIGTWAQSPDGTGSYKPSSYIDYIDLAKDLKYGKETKLFARLKIDMPLIIPNIYLMASPMSFDGDGNKNVTFKFGDKKFDANVPFYSKISLDNYDIALYYGIPFVKTATLKKLNVDVGLNFRIENFKAEINQNSLGRIESSSFTLPVPTLYVAAQFMPIDFLSFEVEGRGVAYSGNSLYSVITRAKAKIMFFFAAVGYRYDKIALDTKDIDMNTKFDGIFAEVGCQF
ncbi:MAG: TIGR04219 family outer membrane beta-barrel protein [Desulfobacterales bacterium]|nr:TIGR04219 family outer membrane beta-barrel protein [Desulfobacterales bacterium]